MTDAEGAERATASGATGSEPATTGSAPVWKPPEYAPSAAQASQATARPPGYRSAHLRSRWAIGLLALAGAVDFVNLLTDLVGLRVTDAIEAGTITQVEAEAFDLAFAAVGLVQTSVYLAAAFTFLAWLSRIVENVPALGAGKPSVSPRAAIGWWFVPFANLIKPYLIVGDVHDRLAPGQARPGRALVRSWWLVWLAGNILSNVALRVVLGEPDTVDDLRLEFGLFAASDAATTVAAVLAVLLVRRIQNWADSRAAAHPLASVEAPMPA